MASRSSWRIRSCTRGCTMAFSFARRPGSAKTSWPRRSRSRRPSGRITSGPNTAAIWPSPGVPGSTTSRAATSASTIAAPCAASRRDTSLLPEPIPPVSPTRSTRTSLPSQQPNGPGSRGCGTRPVHDLAAASPGLSPGRRTACRAAPRGPRRRPARRRRPSRRRAGARAGAATRRAGRAGGRRR